MSTFSNDDSCDISSFPATSDSSTVNKLKKQVEQLLNQVTALTNTVNIVAGDLTRHTSSEVTEPGNDVHAVNEKYADIFITLDNIQHAIDELDTVKQDKMNAAAPASYRGEGYYSTPKDIQDALLMSEDHLLESVKYSIPIGLITNYWLDQSVAVPEGWCPCDGRSVRSISAMSREEQSRLINILHTAELPIADNMIILCYYPFARL